MARGHLTFDVTELRVLAVDFSEAPARIQRNAPKALKRGAELVQAHMRIDAGGHRYLPKFANKVGISRKDSIGLAWEVGFDKAGQGKLANIIVFGSINNAPVYDFDAALRRSLPRIIEDMAGAGEESVFGGPR